MYNLYGTTGGPRGLIIHAARSNEARAGQSPFALQAGGLRRNAVRIRRNAQRLGVPVRRERFMGAVTIVFSVPNTPGLDQQKSARALCRQVRRVAGFHRGRWVMNGTCHFSDCRPSTEFLQTDRRLQSNSLLLKAHLGMIGSVGRAPWCRRGPCE